MKHNLTVVGFGGTRRASEVLSELQKLDDDWVIDLEDAVAAFRTDDGQLRIDQSVIPTRGQGADMGALVAGMLGAIVAPPLTGGLSADAKDWKAKYGITDDFVADVGRLIQPGSSAVFALLRTGSPDVVLEHFRGYGGKILSTTLSPRDAARVERTIRG